MQKKQVAVLDIGSSKITAVVGERGINKTFNLKCDSAFEYDGFIEGAFINTDSLKRALFSAVECVRKAFHGEEFVLYVGVPAAFTSVVVKNSQISFPKSKKITEADVESLYSAAFVISSTKHTIINRSPIIYELSDSRRVMQCVGEESEVLKGVLSFVLCDNVFMNTVKSFLKAAGISETEFVSASLAEAMYLIDAEVRDRMAIILDVGYISTSLSIVQGDGLIFEQAFDFGGGYITAAISEKFDIGFGEAEKLKRKVNLSRVSAKSALDVIDGGNGEYYSLDELRDNVKMSIEGLCEMIANCLEGCKISVPEYVPIMITGGGISYIRGACEHMANRLGCMVEVLAPAVPLMDEPTKASELSLVDIALKQ